MSRRRCHNQECRRRQRTTTGPKSMMQRHLPSTGGRMPGLLRCCGAGSLAAPRVESGRGPDPSPASPRGCPRASQPPRCPAGPGARVAESWAGASNLPCVPLWKLIGVRVCAPERLMSFLRVRACGGVVCCSASWGPLGDLGVSPRRAAPRRSPLAMNGRCFSKFAVGDGGHTDALFS